MAFCPFRSIEFIDKKTKEKELSLQIVIPIAHFVFPKTSYVKFTATLLCANMILAH